MDAGSAVQSIGEIGGGVGCCCGSRAGVSALRDRGVEITLARPRCMLRLWKRVVVRERRGARVSVGPAKRMHVCLFNRRNKAPATRASTPRRSEREGGRGRSRRREAAELSYSRLLSPSFRRWPTFTSSASHHGVAARTAATTRVERPLRRKSSVVSLGYR